MIPLHDAENNELYSLLISLECWSRGR